MSAIRSCKTLLIVCSCWVLQPLQAQTPHTGTDYPAGLPVNYVRTWDATAPVQDPNVLMTRPLQDVKQATQYIDGLGRPLQTVIKQGSLVTGQSPTDMVSPVEYDAFGREQYKWMPYADPAATGTFKTNPFSAQTAFYSNANGVLKGQGENYFYNQTQYEASPLNRVQENFAPGVSWAGTAAQALEANRHSVKIKYWANTATDDVKMWTVTDVAGSFGDYTVSTVNNGAGVGIYPAGQLYKNVTLGEHNKQVEEFKDKEGKVILKKVQLTAASDDGTGRDYTGWLSTYYIYDDFGNLRAVIQPEGVKALSTNNWQLTSTLLNEQCFRYEYDQRNRMIKKKVPGAGEVWMVYDSRDRLVLTQDANMRSSTQQKWMYTQYDELNRPVATGLITDAAHYTDLAYHLTAAYSSTAYPNLALYSSEELTHTFYDDYSWLGTYGNPLASTYNSSYDTYFQTVTNNNWPYPQANQQSTKTKGLPTGSRIKVLGTATYLYTVSFYDEKARVIQTQSTNNSGGTDIATTQYSWAGQPLVVIQKQEKQGTNAQTTVAVSQLTYDDLGRVTKTEKKVSNTLVNANAMPAYKTIAQNEYNALGQLKKKSLAPAYNSNAGLESLNYEYNIRGWMLGTNRDYVKDINPSASANTGNGYFGFDLGYDKINNGLINNQNYTAAQYNGNIEGMVWKSKGDGEKRKYDFAYDAANRILSADFNQYNGSIFDKSAQVDFSMSNMSYDGNGNILTMNQKGLKINTSSFIDQLSYTYQPGSNKLVKVSDGITTIDNGKLGDFKDGNNTSDDYSYDVNGNMNQDNNKAISSITYNYLNLPQVITVTGKGTITYTYDAAGNKLRKVTVDNTATPTKTTVTDYIGGLVYENDVLQFIPQEEGRIRFKPATGNIAASLQYDYMLKDHLGNVRMVLTEEQQSDPYPAATMETAQAANEGNYYTNLNTGVAKPAGYPNDASTNITNPNDRVAKLNGSGNKIGPSIILKVMAGDKFNVRVSSWYKTNGVAPAAPQNPLPDLIAALSGSAGSITANGFHGSSTTTEIVNSNVLTPGATQFLSNRSYTGTKPKAYLNWILLDEHFNVAKDDAGNIIASGYSGAEQVPDESFYGTVPNNTVKWHTQNDLPINKSGYLYVYVSNETPNIDVFFDNLQVTHTRGAVLEETSYYPFGLTMEGISSKAAQALINNKKYNGYEQQNKDFCDGSGLEWYDYKHRFFDDQIGRFFVEDRLASQYVYYSPYQFAGNAVPNAIDLDGLEPLWSTSDYNRAEKNSYDYLVQSGAMTREQADHQIAVSRDGAAKGSIAGVGLALSFLFPNTASLLFLSLTTEIPVIPSPQAVVGTAASELPAVVSASEEAVNVVSLADKARVLTAGGEIGMMDGAANLSVNAKSGYFNMTIKNGSETGVLSGEIKIVNNTIQFGDVTVRNLESSSIVGAIDKQGSIGFPTFNKLQKEMTELTKAGGYDKATIEFSKLRPDGSPLPDMPSRTIPLFDNTTKH